MLDTGLQQWRPSSAWDAAGIEPGRFGAKLDEPGVTFELLGHRDSATIIIRDGQHAAFADFVTRRYGVPVPESGRAAFGDGALIWSAPGQWLAAAPAGGHLDDLQEALIDVGAVTAQGDGRALVRIGGSAARRALAKLIAIDLHPSVFNAGSAATLAMAHLSVQLWVENDAPTYMLAIPRTMAGYLWRSLTMSAAEYGYEICE